MRKMLILSILCMLGCIRRPLKADSPLSKPIITEAFTAVPIASHPGMWHIWIRRSSERLTALRAVGCGPCAIQPNGYVITIQRR